MATIQIKRTNTANLFDSTSGSYGLQAGELGLDLTNNKLYCGTNGTKEGNRVLNPEGGVASEAGKLSVPRDITLEGMATGSTSFDGSQNVTINVTLQEIAEASEKLYAVAIDKYGRVLSGVTELTISDVTGLTEALEQAKTYTDDQIKLKLSSVYRIAGSSDFASLPEPSKDLVGNVYNITDEFEADAKFVTGEVGKTYPAGTNIVCIELTGGEPDPDYKYDVLSGIVDLTNYTTTEQLEATKTELIGTQEGITANTIKDGVKEAKDYTDTQLTPISEKVTEIETALGGSIPEHIVSSIIAGNGISISGDTDVTVSANVVQENGLSVSVSGISMAVADSDNFGAVKADNDTIKNTSGTLSVEKIDGGEVGA